jgi:hypothetical protein
VSFRSLRSRLDRLGRVAGPCPACRWPAIPASCHHVVIEAGDPAPPSCPLCGRPSVLVVKSVVVEAGGPTNREGP